MYLLDFEGHWEIEDAIVREKQMKKWKREWKINLIKENNTRFIYLSEDWFDKSLQLKNSSWG
jgi:putative endonuclease